jgi:hypothetical protein
MYAQAAATFNTASTLRHTVLMPGTKRSVSGCVAEHVSPATFPSLQTSVYSVTRQLLNTSK